MRTIEFDRIPEQRVPGKPLGRTILHDSKSKEYRVSRVANAKSVVWERVIDALDQDVPKPLGSCTGNATVGTLGTEPFFTALADLITKGLRLDEPLAISIYSEATKLDHFAGTYPPTDTGSNGLSVAKAALKAGYISGYEHALGIDDLISGMQTRPCIIGLKWKTGSDNPDARGIIRYTGDVRGGHEIEGAELDLERGFLTIWNSWGPDWGLGGKAKMPLEDVDLALKDRGDATFFNPLGTPAPTPTPVPANTADQDLVAAMDPWIAHIHSTNTDAGRAKNGYVGWKNRKGL